MKREILFRGKQVDGGKWIEGSLIILKRRFGIGYFISQISSIILQFAVLPETVGQFTGLTDKNGVKVSEGDVCKCRYYKHAETDLRLIQKVVFDHASFFVVVGDFIPDLETETYSNCPLSWVNEIEVIGNIHDNPELLNP